MSSEMSAEELADFLGRPHEAVLSVELPSGRAMGTPIWFRWVDGVARFQSPTTTVKTEALRRTGRASLCVHEQALPLVRAVTITGPVREVDFDVDRDIGAAAAHYLGPDAPMFMAGISAALAAGRRWASFELVAERVLSSSRALY